MDIYLLVKGIEETLAFQYGMYFVVFSLCRDKGLLLDAYLLSFHLLIILNFLIKS